MSKQELIDQLTPVEASCVDITMALGIDGIGTKDWHSLPRQAKYDRLRQVIGQTPVTPVTLPGDITVTTKQEYWNPSGSHYDRAFLDTLQAFETEGLIQPGDELRDITSGSGGISLALLTRYLGYKARITVPDELPVNRLIPMRLFDAEVVQAGPGYIQQAAAVQTAEIQALKKDATWELTRPNDRNQRAYAFANGEQRICYLNHSENTLSPQAFQAIGHELVSQIAEAPAAVMLAVGNWTTIAGISPVLRDAWPQTQLIGYQSLFTDTHDNFGTTVAGINLRFEDMSLLDDIYLIPNQSRDIMDAHVNARLPLAQQLGRSSLMGFVAAQYYADLGDVVTIAYDQKMRY